MSISKYIIVSVLFLIASTGVMADCSHIFNNNKTPYYFGNAKTVLLCNTEFATMYSPQVKTPMFSYEHITSDGNVPRQGKFHPDTRLPQNEQSLDSDYVKSGYDRGHIAPSGDMTTVQSQNESFLFSNIAPQASKFNQQQWRLLEASVKHKFPYIVTGVIYKGGTIKTIGKGVGVPTQFYKVVSDGITCSTAYLADNDNNAVIAKVSLNEIEALTNIDFYLPYKLC